MFTSDFDLELPAHLERENQAIRAHLGRLVDDEATRAHLIRLIEQTRALAWYPYHRRGQIRIVRPATRWADLVPDGHAELLAGALACAARGWRVFPLVPALVDDQQISEDYTLAGRTGKVPALKDWQTHATTAAPTIEDWWTKRPRANIGIATGAAGDLTVVDVDVKTTKDGTVVDGRISMLRLEQSHGDLPLGPRVRRGDGVHLYFKHVPGLITKADVLPGVDIRNDKGLVVGAGSFHRRGGRYFYAADTETLPVPAMPSWLAATLLAAQERGGKTNQSTPRTTRTCVPALADGDVMIPADASEAELRARRYVSRMPPSISGNGGHQALWYATCRAMHGFAPGLGDEVVYRVLVDEFNGRCEPPWSERELRHKIEDAKHIDRPELWRVVKALGAEEFS